MLLFDLFQEIDFGNSGGSNDGNEWVVGVKIATDMLEDAETEISCGPKGSYDFRSTLMDSYTKVLARQLMKRLRENWRSGVVDMALGKV